MFVALDSTGLKRFSFKDDKEDLRLLSSLKMLSCPNCKSLVFFHGGEKRIHHFNHEAHVECSSTGEPETQEHLNGKLIIYERLKELYPRAEVSLERRITETKQIADVYLAFSNGTKFAFEIQCAELTAEDWLARRKLYRQANIRDIWLFGEKYFKELESENSQRNKMKLLRLKYLQQLVNQKDRAVYFIDSKTSRVKMIGRFFLLSDYSETRYWAEVQSMPIQNLKIIKVQSPCRYMLVDSKTIKKIELHLEKRAKEAKQFWDSRAYEKQWLTERLEQFESYKSYLNSFTLETALQQMSFREQVIFKQLIKEYRFTDENFPGIFNIQLEGYHYIQTPYPLWQLLVFHKAVKHNTSKKKLIFPQHFFQDIKTKIRYEVKYSKFAARLTHNYLEILESCGYISNKFYNKRYIHPFSIESELLSKMEDKNQNSLLAMNFSKFNNNDEWDQDLPKLISNEMEEELTLTKHYYSYLVMNQIE